MKNVIISIGSSLVTIAIVILIYNFVKPVTKIAYVENAKVMVGFSEAAHAERDLKTENDKWQAELKLLQDTLAAQIDLMSKEYDRATPQRKKELQDLLAASNQRVNNFKQASITKMEKLRSEKLKSVVDKINVYIQEYGTQKKYDLILGTAEGGSILYGNNQRYDITNEIIKGFNERYK